MKNGMKRLIAMVLLLCSLCSFIVPATFAEDEGKQNVITYNFALYEDEAFAGSFIDKNGVYQDRDYLTHNCYDCKTPMRNCIKDKFANGNINWMLEATSFAQARIMAAGYESGTAKGLCLRYNAGTTTDGTGNWAAFRVKVDAAGEYTVSIGKTYAYATAANLYIFPAQADTMSEEALLAAMTDGNKVGKASFEASVNSCEVGVWNAETVGEYIIVLKNTDNFKRIYFNEIVLTPKIEEVPEETTTQATTAAVTETTVETTTEATTEATTEETNVPAVGYQDGIYNFALYEDEAFAGSFIDKNRVYQDRDYLTHNCYDCKTPMRECIQNKFISGDINWMLETTSFGQVRIMASGYENGAAGGLCARYNAGTTTNGTDNWIAFRVKVDTANTYEVSVVKDYANHGYDARMYMFPAEAETMSEEAILAAMTEENTVGKVSLAKAADCCKVGDWNIEAAGEYIVVLKNIGTSNRIYVDQILLQEKTAEAPTETTTEATTEPTKPPTGSYKEGFYNFELYEDEAFAPSFIDANGVYQDRDYMTHNCYACKTPMRDCLKDRYAEGQINWLIESTSFAQQRILASGHTNKTVGGICLRFNAGTSVDGTGNWVAFRMKVDTAGDYTITVNKINAYASTADLYIFPATADKMTDESLFTSMSRANYVGAMQLSKDANAAKVGNWSFANAGEYIFLLKTTDETKRMYISSIALTEVLQEQPITPKAESVYDFDLVSSDAGFLNSGLGGRYNNDRDIRVNIVLDQMFAEGKLPWKYENVSPDAKLAVFKFLEGSLRYKDSVNTRDLSNQWYAFRIKNPGTATYDIRLTTSDKSKICGNIYLIPVSAGVAQTQEQIQGALTSENLLVKGAIFDDKGTFYLGEYTFGMKEEYLLVFEFTKGTLLYLNEIRMTLDGTVADGTVKKEKIVNGSIYNFALADPLDGYLSGSKYTMTQAKAEMQSLWRSGKINWCWESACDYLSTSEGSDNIRFYRDTGLRIFNQADNWSAYRIKSPGKGEFTLTLEHMRQFTSGTIAVYILPGDTEDVEKAMDPKNRVGKVAMYNNGDSGKTESGVTSFVGYWEFEAGKEYIVVFEAYETSPYRAISCYVDISKMIAQRGHIDYTSQEEKSVKPITISETPIPVADPLHYNIVTEVYGHDYFFLPMEGKVTLVYDLDTTELVDVIPTNFTRVYDMHQDENGIIWICGSAKHLIRYDPYTQQTFQTPSFLGTDGLAGAGAGTIYPTPDGNIWFATYGAGVLGYYNYETNEYTVLEVMEEAGFAAGMVYHDGYLYFNAHNSEGCWVLKYDIETKQRVASCDITHLLGSKDYYSFMSMLGDGDYLVLGSTGTVENFVAVDPKTMEVYEDHGMFSGLSMRATEIIDGKQYFVCVGLGLYQYDVETKEFSKVPGFGNSGLGFHSSASNRITLEDVEYLITYTSYGGHPRLYNLETKEYKAWDTLVRHAVGGAKPHSLINGEAGDDRIYIGAANTPQLAIYDESEGKIVGYVETGGQGDSAVWYEGKFYTGNYSSTTLNEIPMDLMSPEYPAENEFTQRWKLDHDLTGQKRIHWLDAGDGYIFAGTVPNTDVYGGAIVVYNTRNGNWYYDRSATPNQSVTKVTYGNKVLLAATSTAGGTTTTALQEEGVSATIVAYDYENRKLLATLDPREHISGLPEIIDFIAGMEKDPVVEDRYWGVVSETLFCFTYDKDSNNFQVQEVISFDKSICQSSESRHLWSRKILFDTERNYLYFSFDVNGGFQRIEIADWNAPFGKIKVASNTRLMGDMPVHYTMGQDGNIYYGGSPSLDMLPLNVTDEDWVIAEVVDQMIASLGEITLESEAAIKSARSAYENLSWRYKALIQNLELLKEAETDLLECKIDTVVIENVDADSLPELQVLAEEYKGMGTRYQKYVKNYDYFLEAYNKAAELNDQRVAEALQSRINALKDKFPLTLEDEADVKQNRADFDALSGPQRMLIDLTIQEEAETQIKALRVELVKTAEKLIQAIPNEITLEDEPVIEAAREVVEKLYNNELKQISYAKYDTAAATLRSLKNAKAAAEDVDALISTIGIVTLGDKDRIAEARKAYNALNDTGRSFVTKANKLNRAEFILKALQTWGIPVIAVTAVFAVICMIPSARKKIFKGRKQEVNETDG